MIKERIRNLEDAITNGTFGEKGTGLFQGAGIIVTANKDRAHREGDILVVTPHAKAVSTLLFELRDIFKDDVDYFNKFQFYERLAKAANKSIANGGSKKDLLLAIIEEGKRITGEKSQGYFLGEKQMEIYYFAYGSNMSVEQMAYRCPGAKPLGKAFLEGYRFALDDAGVATVIKQKNSVVQGVLWVINKSNEKSLDRYEGVDYGCYEKVALEVKGKKQCCTLVYVSLREEGGVFCRSGYMDGIIDAAREWKFDENYITMLENF